jgi:nucleoside phosphorylase
MADPIDLALYTVGWIAPMALELAPAVALLDEYVKIPIPEDGTLYHAGRVVDHHVVMVVCPRTGTSPASATVANLCRSFPNIKHVLVVGIAGGIPRYGVDDQEQVVLGDIIVGVPQNRDGGVAHYEFGAWDGNGNLSVRGHMLHPSRDLLIALNNLRNAHMQKGGSKISQFLGELRNRLADNEVLHFQDPGPEHDHCFNDDYAHSDRARSCQMACDFTRSIRREERGQGAMREADNPRVHYGTIGSANTLIISSTKRNELSSRHNIICFEMESAGVMSEQQGLVIRGISDYADSHKNKRWQKYAAATAASCAKELLLFLPKARLAPREVSDLAIYKQGERRALNSIRGGVHQVISTGSGNHIVCRDFPKDSSFLLSMKT